jgi:predicted amidohydrolase YtcJ
VPPPGQGADYKGYPAFRDGQLFPVIKEAMEKQWQVLAHYNGDAAADQFIAALKQAGTAEQVRATRPVMIHAQTVREDQLDEMEKYGIIPSFFSMHTYYWGDWHRDETLGKERAFRSRSGDVIGPDQRISMAEALKALTIHAAYQYGEERRKWSIEVGKVADFVILSRNPTTVDADKIMDIKVLETIKEGKPVCVRN